MELKSKAKAESTNLQRGMSTAVIQKGTAEEIEQLLAAKQETGLWEKSYNCLLQEHEVFQNDLMELQDKLVGMQKEYENSQKELLSCSKSCSIKVSKLETRLQNAIKQRENLKTQLSESRAELRENKELNSLQQKEVLEIQQQAHSYKEEAERLENANRDLVSKIVDLNEQISQRRMAFESHADNVADVETELSWFQSKLNELFAVFESLKAENDGHQREILAIPVKGLTTNETDEKMLGRTKELELENSELHNTIAELLAEMSAQETEELNMDPIFAQSEIEKLSQKLEESSIQISQLETRFETAIREGDDLREELSSSERRLSQAKDLLQNVEDANYELEEKMVNMQRKIINYQRDAESASSQNADLKTELEEERSKVKRLNAEVTKFKHRSDELERNADLKQREIHDKDKVIQNLTASLAANRLRTESLLSELNAIQAQVEISEDEKLEMQDELYEAQKRIQDVDTHNRLITEENGNLSFEVQRFYQRLSELKASYKTCEHEKFDFQHQTMALQERVSKLEAQNNRSFKLPFDFSFIWRPPTLEYIATYDAVKQETDLRKKSD